MLNVTKELQHERNKLRVRVGTLHQQVDVNDCFEKFIQVLEIRNFTGTLNPTEFTISTSKGIKRLLHRQEASTLKADRKCVR
jgi:hypothetical protein